jgi:hypothetical protein
MSSSHGRRCWEADVLSADVIQQALDEHIGCPPWPGPAIALGFVLGRIYQIRSDLLERRAEPPVAGIPQP